MKNYFLLLAFLSLLLHAQVYKGIYAVHFGLTSSLISTINNLNSDWNRSATPVLNAGIEPMLSDHFALGLQYRFAKYYAIY